MTLRTTRRTFFLLTGTALLVTGCAQRIPRDTQGTLERVTGGTLHVGVSENPPWTEIAVDGTVSGSEAELVTSFAESIGAEIDWVPGTESVLAESMTRNELDLIVAGLTSDNPWTAEISSTRPYTEVRRDDGSTQKLVIGVRPGENALQVALERFLAEEAGEL